jgi:hypothetical protein
LNGCVGVHSSTKPTAMNSASRSLISFAIALLAIGNQNTTATADEASKTLGNEVDFARHVQPVLSARCYKCHGPKKQDGGIRWDRKASALAGGDSGEVAIAPGKPDDSEIVHRLMTDDPDERMPPAKGGKPLAPEQIAIITRWIEQGANWPDSSADAKHWSYLKPQRPELAKVNDTKWPRNAIDHFILARLEAEGLTPSKPADPARLIRRVYLDVIGLPPSVEEVEAFLKDPSPDHYEKIVDRLLASKRFGEKWARQWLDLARYSDSNGFQADQIREMWAYRDWVIDALNADMPFDQFTIEQVAGDLLPDATARQKIATGFHRTPTCNVEAGVDPEENRTNQVIDRVNTTGTVWLGTTLECAQCHNHKYDPFTQKDYYQIFAFFNNTPLEVANGGKGVQFNFIGPKMDIPLLPEQASRKAELQKQYDALIAKRQQANASEKKRLNGEIKKFKKQIDAIRPATTLVMVESDKPRMTKIFKRGNFLDKGLPVQATAPSVLHALPENTERTRLGLAKWLVSRDNPLVARVTVNRWWEEIFGRGIVRTCEDFGRQGERPSHPRLLDWLAVELMDRGWSMKHMLKQMVTSATYQQSARVTPAMLAKDFDNVLLARGPRVRLAAEVIRDNALHVAGLLSAKMYGPPVYPPQPPGLWHQTGRNEPEYNVATSEDRFRRGIYVVWRRAAPYPSFINFDAPDRMKCIVQRSRTNTPLQALTLMNDEAYVEAAKSLAARIITDRPDANSKEQIEYAVRLCLARKPRDAEVKFLESVFQAERQYFTENSAAAQSIIANFKLPAGRKAPSDIQQWASWFCVANVLLNLDETITK